MAPRGRKTKGVVSGPATPLASQGVPPKDA